MADVEQLFKTDVKLGILGTQTIKDAFFSLNDSQNLLDFVLESGIKTVVDVDFDGSTKETPTTTNTIRELIFPDSLEEIGDGAFNGLPIYKVDLNKVKSLGQMSFANCPITNLIFSPNLVELYAGTFPDLVMEEITIPATIEKIGLAGKYFGSPLALGTVETIRFESVIPPFSLEESDTDEYFFPVADSFNHCYVPEAGYEEYKSVFEYFELDLDKLKTYWTN